MKNLWWKVVAFALIIYSVIYGLTGPVPDMGVVRESARSLYFHLPMWFTMMSMFVISCVYSVMYLNSKNPKHDTMAGIFASVGVVFGLFGFATGMMWATFTWGKPWSNDPKQIGTALCMLTYMAYLVLRANIKNSDKLGNVAAVYNIFAFAIMIPLIYVLPDVTGESLHPGAGGNVGFGDMDKLDGGMRQVLYPAALGWILVGVWIAGIKYNISFIKEKIDNR